MEKYPKTKLYVLVGPKALPMYTDLNVHEAAYALSLSKKNEAVTFNVAYREDGGLWYPPTEEEPKWMTNCFRSTRIIGFTELPKPKMKVIYDGELS